MQTKNTQPRRKWAQVAMASALAAGAGSGAQAQSSVTIQGSLDVNLRMVRNDSTLRTLSTNGTSASNIALRGVEDLGGGLSASFWLETSVGLDTGAAGASGLFWDRRATLGLQGRQWGEFRMGRDYVPTYANISRFDPLKALGVGNGNNLEPTTNSLGSSANTLIRSNNTLSYFTPSTLGGFYAHAMYAPGESLGNRFRGLRVGYAEKSFELAVGYGATVGDVSGNEFKVVNVGGTYDFGVIRAMAFWQKASYLQRRQDNYLVGAVVPAGTGEVRVSYQRADQSGAGTDANDAQQMALSYFHPLSKRTALYATASKVFNSGVQTYRASSSGGPLTPGRDSTGMEFGVQHRF